MSTGRDRLCIALDYPSRAELIVAARRFVPRAGWLKIGLEAFVAEGPALVAEVASLGARVFLDLKFHDIPNTVARAIASAARTGASLVNVHASGGRAMLSAASAAAAGFDPRPRVVAVTLLTSIDAAALSDLPMAGQPESIARRLAVLSRDCGLDGVVCSASDLRDIRGACGPGFLTVVPGIRPAGSAAGDQRRTASPREAIEAGADILVVGRPITAAPDPDEAVDRILEEIESARVAPHE
ncbi:MAG: orotidine-5'-phosphate decarboxylase [Acidobacteriota bacterium]